MGFLSAPDMAYFLVCCLHTLARLRPTARTTIVTKSLEPDCLATDPGSIIYYLCSLWQVTISSPPLSSFVNGSNNNNVIAITQWAVVYQVLRAAPGVRLAQVLMTVVSGSVSQGLAHRGHSRERWVEPGVSESFPVLPLFRFCVADMHGCESWIVKKAEHRRTDAFELGRRKRLLRVPWTARRSNQSILKEISPEFSL